MCADRSIYDYFFLYITKSFDWKQKKNSFKSNLVSFYEEKFEETHTHTQKKVNFDFFSYFPHPIGLIQFFFFVDINVIDSQCQ